MTGRSSSPLEIRLMTAVVIVGTFVSGAAIGGGLCYWVHHRQHHTIPAPLMGLLIGELGLDEAQEAKARAIVEGHRPELEAIMRESFPRVRAVDDRIEREVRAVLTEPQRRTLNRLKSERAPPFRGGTGRFYGPGGERHHWPGTHAEPSPAPGAPARSAPEQGVQAPGSAAPTAEPAPTPAPP